MVLLVVAEPGLMRPNSELILGSTFACTNLVITPTPIKTSACFSSLARLLKTAVIAIRSIGIQISGSSVTDSILERIN